jgi:hypothetical protein
MVDEIAADNVDLPLDTFHVKRIFPPRSVVRRPAL